VCKFLSTGFLYRYGMDCINVNLSVMHCMQPDFLDHIHQTVEEFAVDKNSVNFEITESVAANDYSILSNVVSELKGSGFMFSMDDFGTGYSNMSSMFSLDFDIVKIDKSILWGAFESDHGRIILENSVAMIRRMGQQILVEGVETAEQLDLLQKLRVDYLQGYYFSKPLPQDDFVAFISDKTEAAKA
jgi:EAL domain-containing protein (putative c-di-GMP-specific phosphodiesterase class I)